MDQSEFFSLPGLTLDPLKAVEGKRVWCGAFSLSLSGLALITLQLSTTLIQYTFPSHGGIPSTIS